MCNFDHSIIFLDQDNKSKLVSAYNLKIKFSSQTVIVIIAIISPYCNETNQTVLFALLLQKMAKNQVKRGKKWPKILYQLNQKIL